MENINIIAEKIARDLAGKNLQASLHNASMRDIPIDSNEDLDQTLATHFYNFLSGKSNEVPTFEYIDYIMSLAKSDTISFNCGVYVLKDLKLISIDLASPRVERRDIITSDDHNVVFANYGDEDLTFEKVKQTSTTTPRFAAERVKIVQELIRTYNNERVDENNRAR